ncbi:MAG: MFS transporter [Steroidobacter sp.]
MSTRTLQVSAGSLAILALSFAGFICLGLPDGTLAVAWPSMRVLFGREHADFGTVLLTHGVTYFLSGLITARLLSRFATATLLTAASLFATSGMLTIASASIWPAMLAGIVLIGIGSGVINTTLNTYASRNFSPRHVNWLHASYSLGASLGPLVMTAVIARQFAWQWGYVLIAVVPLSMAVVHWLNARQWAAPSREPTASGVEPASGFDTLLLRQACLFFCYSGLELTLGRWCYTVLTEWRGLTPEAAGFTSSCFFGGVFLGRLLLGAVVDRVGPTRMVRMGIMVAVIGTACYAFANDSLAAAGLAMTGFALGPIFPTLIAQASGRFSYSQLPRVISISVASAILGSAVVPYSAGLATNTFGLMAVPVTTVMFAIILVVLHETLARARR